MGGNAKNKASEDDGIFYSGQALKFAAALLGIQDVEAELEKDSNSSHDGDIGKPFKKHMGLGSKLPSKHQTGIAGVEHKLGKKIMMSRKVLELDAATARNHNNKKIDTVQDDSDDSEGRGAAIGKNKRKKNDIALRAELLSTGSSKKRRRR